MSDAGISEASLSPMVEMCRFSSSAISRGSVIICSAILISEIIPTLFQCREESSLIKCKFFFAFFFLGGGGDLTY